jgi:antitoxin component YwqK of YwqJK toxin-antitoxin module
MVSAPLLLTYWPDGVTKKNEWQLDAQGRAHGQHLGWYEDGPLAVCATFRHGERHGWWRSFHRNGARRAAVRYNNGTLVPGRSDSWYASGALHIRSTRAGKGRGRIDEYFYESGGRKCTQTFPMCVHQFWHADGGSMTEEEVARLPPGWWSESFVAAA